MDRGVLAPAILCAVGLSVVAASMGAEPPTPDAVRPCGSRGDTDRPQQLPPSPGARIGPLVIWPSIRDRLEGHGRNGVWPFYVKAPIVLRARSVVTLAVAPGALDLVGFQVGEYAAGRKWVSSVRFEACRESVRAFPHTYNGTVGKYTAFPFGFGLARRSVCVPLEVWVDGRSTPIRQLVPFGRNACR